MGKLRLVFAKEGRAVYISHLDLLRTFQRVFIRQGLVLRHSQGFHPHPILSFALPLPLGQSSQCELLDFEVTEDMDGGDLPEKLNPFMPEGIRAVSCYVPQRPIRQLERLRCQVDLVYDAGTAPEAPAAVTDLLLGESVVIEKRTKRRDLAEVDLRPMLFRLEAEPRPDRLVLLAEVAAQNPGMNPVLLAAAVERYLPEFAPDFVQVRRLAVLDGQGEVFC